MLNFKIGQFYKDTNGKEWRFCGYYPNDNYPYIFIDKKGSVLTCLEEPDNLVTEYDGGEGIRIPFVEEKERDWVIGEEYECFDAVTQRVIKARLTKIIKKTGSHLFYMFNINGISCGFHDEGIVLVMGRFVVFKDDVPQELKDKLNKKKLTNKRKSFQKGQVYKDIYGAKYMFIKRIKAPDGLYAIFYEKEDDEAVALELYKINNVECCLLLHRVDLCPDESIRNEDTSKAVRVVQ